MPRKTSLSALKPHEEAQLKVHIEQGLPWSTILEWVTGLGVTTSESGLRRWATANGVEKPAFRADADGDSVEAKLTAQVEHLEAELVKAGRVVAKARAAANENAAIEAAVERAITQHEPVHLSPHERRPPSGTAQEFLAAVSDAHYGEVVDPELAHGVSYNPEIARKRMAYLRDKIIRYANIRPYAISKLHVAVIGDMTSGNNHEDLDVTNALGMVDQAMDMADMLFDMATEFRSRFDQVDFHVVTGNHGRIHKIPRHKARFDNWDYVTGVALRKMVEQSGLDVRVNAVRGSREIITVAGRRVCLTHGDGVKAASFAGIPWYAMKSKADALQSLMRTLGIDQVDQILMGHFHQHVHWPAAACNIVVNGSIKGGDEFIMDTRYASTPAMQILQEWHPRHGLTCTDYIDLEDVR